MHRLATGGQHARGRGAHLVGRHAGGVAAAQPAFVHKAEMRQVQKILHHTRRAALHGVRAAIDLAQALVRLGGKQRHSGVAGCQTHPQQAIGFAGLKGASAVRGRRGEFWQGRNQLALARAVKLPAVVGTFQLTVLHPPQGELGATVGAAVRPGAKPTLGRLPNDDFLVQHHYGFGGTRQIGQGAYRVPQGFFDHASSDKNKKRGCHLATTPLAAARTRCELRSRRA